MAALLEAASAKGVVATTKQIARWRQEDVLPRPRAVSRGRARGIARTPSDATLDQLVALDAILKRNRSLDYAAFRLWLRGFDVPIERIRRALASLVFAPFERTRGKSTDELIDYAITVEEKAAVLRTAPKRTRQMAKAGRLAPALATTIQLLFDSRNVSDAERTSLARDFADLGSLEKAKTGVPALGIPGWLQDDPSNDLREAIDIVPGFVGAMETLNASELDATREPYRKLERMLILMQLVQKAAKDEDALGFGMLTHGAFGSDMDTISPFLFAAMAFLMRVKPDLPKRVDEMTSPVEAVLQQFREAGIAVPEY